MIPHPPLEDENDEPDYAAADAFAEECSEKTDEELLAALKDTVQAADQIRWELRFRGYK